MKKGIVDLNAELSWIFLDGSRRGATVLETAIVGTGEYLPGWRWSTHVAPMAVKLQKDILATYSPEK